MTADDLRATRPAYRRAPRFHPRLTLLAALWIGRPIARRVRRLFEISHEQFWIHSISGNRVDHHISRSTVRAAVPLKYNIRLGLEYRLELAERDYQDYEDVSVRNPQARVFLRWILN